MYLSAVLKVENYIYLIECFSRCLISIHIASGETKIEAYLPWKYTENKIGMLLLNHNIFIYSPAMDHFLVYNCLKHQISTMKLEGIEIDKMGFYYSNVLMKQDGFIVLPFKDKEIKWYGANGKLKFKDNQWCSIVARECGCDEKLFGNIRMDSACIVGNQLFFSLIYGNLNYLCRYELKKEEHLCKIIYCSENIAIRGVYAYPDMVLFRRIFPDKTEIVLISLNSGKQKTIRVDYPSMFEEDIYGDICHLRVSLRNEILAIEGKDLNVHRKIYNFKYSDTYIANGIIFNAIKNEICILDLDCIERYSIEKVVREIKECHFYQEQYGKLFGRKYICEGKYKLYNLMSYFIEFLPDMMEIEKIKKNKNIGKLTWEKMK